MLLTNIFSNVLCCIWRVPCTSCSNVQVGPANVLKRVTIKSNIISRKLRIQGSSAFGILRPEPWQQRIYASCLAALLVSRAFYTVRLCPCSSICRSVCLSVCRSYICMYVLCPISYTSRGLLATTESSITCERYRKLQVRRLFILC